MTPTGPAIRRLLRSARTALLVGCLSLLALQQFGAGAQQVLDATLFQADRAETQALASGQDKDARQSLTNDRFVQTCEAVLTDRRVRPTGSEAPRMRQKFTPLCFFHSNLRPAALRTRAASCDFSLLLRVLHPHLHFLANATSVLC